MRLQIGNEYNKLLFNVSIEEAVTVMTILGGKGIVYEGDKVYKPRDVEISIISDNCIMASVPTPPKLPEQIED